MKVPATDANQEPLPPSLDIESLGKSLLKAARGKSTALAAYLHRVESSVPLRGTEAIFHCHFVRLDGNGRPRLKAFVQHLKGHILDYVIPRKEIAAADKELKDTGSSSRLMRLGSEAINLFTRIENTGEGGELLLFTLAEQLLKLPQLICKMSLKTSTSMHYHGADGLHVGVDEESGGLALYWGESKIHASRTNAVYDCFKSISPLLLGEGGTGSPEERDLLLLQRHLDLNDPKLEAALKNYLDPASPLFCKVAFRGLCMVGFDSDAYPDVPNKVNEAQVIADIKKGVSTWKKHISKRVTNENISSFIIHVFCLPFPSVDAFRTAFLHEIGINNGNP